MNSRDRIRRRCVVPLLALAVAAVVVGTPRRAAAVTELVRNGLFTEGDGERPSGWTNESWLKGNGATHFGWEHGGSDLGAVTIQSGQPNDASWVQPVGVSPSTWYRVSAWIRTEDVGRDHVGAYISILDTFHNSQELRGSTDWTPVSLWYRTGSIETSLRIGLRLGGYSSLNTGSASFSLVSVEAAGSPPRDSRHVYGGSAEDAAGGSTPWGRIAAGLVVAGIAGLAWRYLLSPHAPV